LMSLDNCYNWPNFYASSKTCKTNIPANTSTRGPGWVQAIFIAEHVMEHVASSLGKPADVIKSQNFYTPGQVTPYGQTLVYFTVKEMWEQVKASINYQERVQAISTFNLANKWTKRGISLCPTKFCVYWAGDNQATTVNVFADGTVEVFTSGIEMGQGLFTKVAQSVAYALGVPMSSITVGKTTTSALPNAQGTGGSVTSELCVQSALMACQQINERLAPWRRQLGGNPTWQNLINLALQNQVNLQGNGYFDPANSPNGPCQYMSYGVACLEVEVDILTGENQILRCDMSFDSGVSMNPAVDIGQVEGGFIMGLGLHMNEEIYYNAQGELVTNGTWEYKPIMAMDIPIEFNVTLLKNSVNKMGVLGSKAVGEPPLTMGCAGLFAVQNAIAAARTSGGYFELDSPCTVDRIQQTCQIDPTTFTLN